MPYILVVEDYGPLRRIQTATLRRAGWQVAQAKSAREALQELHRQPFDVVLLDMDVASGESWRVLQALQDGYRQVAVVVLLSPSHRSAMPQQVKRRCVKLAKPVGRRALLAGVEQALQSAGSQPDRPA